VEPHELNIRNGPRRCCIIHVMFLFFLPLHGTDPSFSLFVSFTNLSRRIPRLVSPMDPLAPSTIEKEKKKRQYEFFFWKRKTGIT
jgi:hypothetical protein